MLPCMHAFACECRDSVLDRGVPFLEHNTNTDAPVPMPFPDPSPAPPAMDRAALLAALRARIARLDRSGGAGGSAAPSDSVPLCPAIDQSLPGGGLARAAIHEVLAADPGAAACFCALLLARSRGTVLWIAPEPDARPPGLARFGLLPAELVLVQARRPADALWAMEESLRCPGIAGAVLTLDALDMAAARRLQLAAEAGGALGLLLRPDTEAAAPTATTALTRWRVGALPGTGGSARDLDDPRWRLELLRARGGRPHAWPVVWRAAAERLDLDEAAGMEAAASPARRREW